MLVTIDAIIGLLGFVSLLSAVILVAVEQLKPLVLDYVDARYGRNGYLVGVYAVRTLLGIFTVAGIGGAEVFRSMFPTLFIEAIPSTGVYFVIVGLILFGNEFIKVILGLLVSVRELLVESGISKAIENDKNAPSNNTGLNGLAEFMSLMGGLSPKGAKPSDTDDTPDGAQG